MAALSRFAGGRGIVIVRAEHPIILAPIAKTGQALAQAQESDGSMRSSSSTRAGRAPSGRSFRYVFFVPAQEMMTGAKNCSAERLRRVLDARTPMA